MASEKKFGSVKRFGPRYGRKIKAKVASVEKFSKQKQVCPYCNRSAVKRKAVGIWHCFKCDAKFSGPAYYLQKKVATGDIVKAEEQIVRLRKKEEASEEA